MALVTPEHARTITSRSLWNSGPGLSSRYRTFIVARDRTKKRVVVGGLGGMGCGEMWFDEEPKHSDYPGYENAPDAIAPMEGPW